MKKLLSLLVAVLLVVALAACKTEAPTTTAPSGGDTTTTAKNVIVLPTDSTAYEYISADEIAALDDYYAESARIYNEVFGQFAHALEVANTTYTSVSQKWALQAIAEAKLLETGAILPGEGQGGNYAVSKVAYGTVSPVYWGLDSSKYQYALVCTKAIKAEDRAALKALYVEKKGTGTYLAAAKEYLTSHNYEIKRTLNMAYTSDPLTFDIINDYHSATSEPLCLTFDFLYDYDVEGTLVPGLATDKVWSKDGNKDVITFTMREGVKWVDKDGHEVGTVSADDFVAGFQHGLDTGMVAELVEPLIEGVEDYDGTNFDQVGVKAVDGKFVVTFKEGVDTSYFETMLTYLNFAPLNRTYFLANGGGFGEDWDEDACEFGQGPDSILYCGPYIITQFTSENTFVFTKNANYWAVDKVNLDTITWTFNDGKDAKKNYNDFIAGNVDSTGLSSVTLPLAKAATYEGANLYDTYAYVSGIDANTYPFWFNGNRAAYTSMEDTVYEFTSAKTDAQKSAAEAAMANRDFRLALAMSIDRYAYEASTNDPDIALNSVLNSYTPATLVHLTEDVTVKINGTDTTFVKGTAYGEIMQAQLTADGYPMQVWKADTTADDGRGTGHGFDGWYNVEWANAFMERAIATLADAGVTVNKNNPIVLEIPYVKTSTTSLLANKSMAKSIEDTFGGLVVVNVLPVNNNYSLYYAAYFNETGAELNVDISKISGWGPDYGDPNTYLATFLNGAGGMAKNFGIY